MVARCDESQFVNKILGPNDPSSGADVEANPDQGTGNDFRILVSNGILVSTYVAKGFMQSRE